MLNINAHALPNVDDDGDETPPAWGHLIMPNGEAWEVSREEDEFWKVMMEVLPEVYEQAVDLKAFHRPVDFFGLRQEVLRFCPPIELNVSQTVRNCYNRM